MTERQEQFEQSEFKMNCNPALLMEQYKIAVELYRHEDELNWNKLRVLFYISIALAAGLGFLIDWHFKLGTKSPVFFFLSLIGVVSLIGLFLSIALGIALWSGTEYLSERKKQAQQIELLLKSNYGAECIIDNENVLVAGKSLTVKMLRIVPWLLLIVWPIFFAIACFTPEPF